MSNLSKSVFNIYGNKLIFTDLLLDTADTMIQFKKLEKYYLAEVHKFYTLIGKMDDFLKKADEILYEAQLKYYEVTLNALRKANIDIDVDLRKFISYPDELSSLYEYCEELNSYYAEETPYISQKRWVGGGFGITGAIKGAITAGAFNAVGNFVGSIKHSAQISRHNINVDSAKKKVYKDAGFEETFKYSISYLSEMAEIAFKTLLMEQYGSDVYENIDYTEALRIYIQMLDSPEQITKENIAKALQLCPYISEIYYLAFEKIQDEPNELLKLYRRCVKNDKLDKEYNRKKELEKNITNANFSNILQKYKDDKEVITRIKNTFFDEYVSGALLVFEEALNGGDTSKVADMQAFVELMKEHIKNWKVFYLAGKIYEERKYGVEANLQKSIEFYEIAAKSNQVMVLDRLANLCYITDNNSLAEEYARKALQIKPTLLSAKITLASALSKRVIFTSECEEALKLYNELSAMPYSQFEDYRTPAYFCYCAAKIFNKKEEWVNENKKIEWCVRGATIAANYPNDSYGVSCCGAAISLLQKHSKFKQVIELCILYKGRYIVADWLLGYAYCRGHQVPKDFNKGAECFLSVINNYNHLTDKVYQDKRNDAQIALSKMTCSNGIWKKKMFESI